MDKKTTTVVLSLALIVSFFLPLFTGYSGYKIVFGSAGAGSSAVRYLWLLIPVIGLLLLFGALGSGASSSSDSLSWVPLAVLVFFIVRTFLIVKTAGGQHYSLNEYLKILGVGFWIMFISSILLAFYRPSR